MNENNYPNHYESTGNTYRYDDGSGSGVNGSASRTSGNSTYSNAPKPKKTKGSGAGKKIALGICCGLLFGIFAGLGFQAVTTASSFVKEAIENVQETTALPKSTAEEEPAAENSGNAMAEASQEEQNFINELFENNEVRTTVTDVTEVVKAVMPSVVSVSNKYVATATFFGESYGTGYEVSSGSGIIVGQNETELLIVTNYHVIQDAEELTVQFVDEEQVQAQIKGSEVDKDLAIIAVQLSDVKGATMDAITIAELGDSTQLTVGEPVIAIGNSLGYGQSVTTGVVSALDRPIAINTTAAGQTIEEAEVNTFIQTDAAINPGNSGGALLNMKGEVIGINSNKIGGSAIEGMGYAIPISDAHPIIEELMTKETRLQVSDEEKGYLGITGIDVNLETAQVYGMPQGVYVSSVMEGTGAAQAGLVKGDIIVAVNDEEIESMEELKRELSYYAAGTDIELTVMQGSPTGYQAKTVLLTLGRQPANEE